MIVPPAALAPRTAGRLLAPGSALAFAALAWGVASGRLDELDRRLGARLAVREGSRRSGVAEVLSWLGPLPTTAVAGLALVPAGPARVRTACRAVLGLCLGAAVQHATKAALPRPRPAPRRRRLEIPRSPERSFPSGHTIYAILIARQGSTLRPGARARAIGLAWVCGMGVSRLALRAHWPSDVAGGVLAGTALAVRVWSGRPA